MGVTDPRKLAVILRDLENELERWAMKASDTLSTATYTQNITREAVAQSRRQTLIITEQFYEDEAVYRSRKQSVDDLVMKSRDAVELSKALLDTVEKKLQYAKQVLNHWAHELNLAIQWQRRAEERVRRAEAELAAAESALYAAERQLASAQAAYQNCRNTVYEDRDSNGRVVRTRRPDCSGYANAVNSAQNAVYRAQERVQIARAELAAARAELARAIARVRACTQAVDYCKEGVATAEVSLDHANKALSQAERALDHALAAERAVVEAGDKVEKERLEVEDMNVQMQQSEDFLSEGQNHLISSTKYEESSQRYRIMARSELRYRVEMLYAINRPELLGGASGDGWGAIVGGFTGAVAGGGMAMASSAAGGTKSSETKRPKDPTKQGTWLSLQLLLPLHDLPDVPEFADEDSRKKLPLDQLKTLLTNLGEMLPFINDGVGTNLEYWQSRDKETGKESRNGYAAAFESYYGANPIIIVEEAQGELLILQGKERVWLAKWLEFPALPVVYMKRPAYLQTQNFVDAANDNWELRVYQQEQAYALRLFNTSKRSKIPDGLTDGDGSCLDLELDESNRAEIKRFEFRERGYDAESLEQAEFIAQEIKAGAIYLRDLGANYNEATKREWFTQRGYQFNREGQNVIIFKSFG